MLAPINEYKSYAVITGFRRTEIVNIDRFLQHIKSEKNPLVEIQFFDAESVCSWQHLYFAALNALTAFKNRTNISKSLPIETLLYASAQHQIDRALKLVGLRSNSEVAVLIIGENRQLLESSLSMISENLEAEPSDDVLELSDRKMTKIRKIFRISDTELRTYGEERSKGAAIIDCVIERMALLSTKH